MVVPMTPTPRWVGQTLVVQHDDWLIFPGDLAFDIQCRHGEQVTGGITSVMIAKMGPNPPLPGHHVQDRAGGPRPLLHRQGHAEPPALHSAGRRDRHLHTRRRPAEEEGEEIQNCYRAENRAVK